MSESVTNKRNFLKLLSGALFLVPDLIESEKQPLWLVKAKAIDSLFYSDIEFQYSGKKQLKVGSVIHQEYKEQKMIYFGKDPLVSTFEVISHEQIGHVSS